MKMDAAYFIAKFEAIPEELWYEGNFSCEDDPARCCARGHCGESAATKTVESHALLSLGYSSIPKPWGVEDINDGLLGAYPQETPKQRILAWLRDAQEAGL